MRKQDSLVGEVRFGSGAIMLTDPCYIPRENGGVVQNDPGIPVFDMDDLEYVEPEYRDHIVKMRDEAVRLGLTDIIAEYDHWLEVEEALR